MEGKLRLREPQIARVEGGFILTDPYGVFPKPLALTEGGLFLLSLMEGRTLREVQEEVFRAHGVLVPMEELEGLARALEEAGLLLTEGVEQRLREEEEKLKRERPMRLAGISYPEGEGEARAFLEAFRASFTGEGVGAEVLLLPHLEPSRVPEAYGAALAALEKTPPPERVYLVGVAHRPLKERAAALPVPFQTPFGPALPDLEALQALDALLPFELFNTPLAFREEHSLELPLLFLKGAYPGARFLPLLVGRRSPELGEALKVVLRDYPGLLVLAVDLSHVGPRFGDPPLSRSLAEEARKRDLGFLEGLAQGEPEAALARLGANPTRLDATEVVASLAPLLRGRRGQVLAYRLDLEAATLSAVGAGTLAF
ncbi:MAG: AmmeMemoRadiSam system protein B [Thermus sp.]|uniref:AmmeMemoRadiSam system protein B n=1 Tax=Thermus sp. TaxID=275 RepID=UPI0025F9EA7E|nr:AmmeMemoRadiSam system protein B [Thermus sp.]MCS7219502.1 AmmeMemoRadiSam system protein B [Thermus sp.]MCX7848963.1 AmmeMemoRadiSam system protein B [Thermus sp.]